MGDQNLASEPAARSDARDSAKTNGSEANFEKNATRHVARRGARRCLLTASLVACLVALLIVPVPVIAASSPETRRWADPNEVKAGEASETQREEIRSFFSSLDADGDGQVRGDELGAYVASSVGGKDFDTDVEVADAVRAVQERIDGQDTGDAIDAEELMVSLTSTKNQMLRPHKVARWVRHGLNFPQYAERFMSHGITLLDFPALLTDDGAALREELGVESALHRAKLTRALKRQLLQLGRSPGEPTDVRVAVVAEDAVVVKWRPPRKHGHPPVHAYAVQVREPGSHEWRVVGTAPHEDEDEEASAKALVTPTREMAAAAHAAGVGNGRSVPLRFRVVAWGGHGGGVSDESASVEMKPLQRSRREEVRGDGRVESDLIPAGNSIVAGSNPRDAGWSATLLGSLYSALGTFLVAAGIATRFALNGASFIATRGVQFLRRRPKPRREVAADSGAHEPPSRTDEATADGGDLRDPGRRRRAIRTARRESYLQRAQQGGRLRVVSGRVRLLQRVKRLLRGREIRHRDVPLFKRSSSTTTRETTARRTGPDDATRRTRVVDRREVSAELESARTRPGARRAARCRVARDAKYGDDGVREGREARSSLLGGV